MNIGGMVPPKYFDPSFPVHISTYVPSGKPETPSCWHEDLEFKLIHAGKTTVIIDSEIYTAEKDEILFMNPYQIHSMPAIEGNDRLYYLFMIHLDFFQKSCIQSLNLRKLFMQNKLWVHNHIRNAQLSAVLKKIIAADEKQTSYSQTYIQGLLMEFFSILMEEEVSDVVTEELDPDRVKYYHAIENAIENIHMNYNKKISIEELAAMCKMSMYYFHRVFKRVMGVTPVQYQTEYRLQVADMLMKNDHQSISTIAHMVGFNDEAYFSRCYKKYRGISPRQFQK